MARPYFLRPPESGLFSFFLREIINLVWSKEYCRLKNPCPFPAIASAFLTSGAIRTGSYRLEGFGHFRHNIGEALGFGGGNPLQPETLRLQAEVFQHHINGFRSVLCFFITFQVMTFAQVSATHQHPVSTLGKSVDDQIRVYHTGTHHPDNPAVRGILDPGNSGQISTGIGAPITEEGDNKGFVFITHRSTSLSGFRFSPIIGL
jgi:hypothetical protein